MEKDRKKAAMEKKNCGKRKSIRRRSL